MFYSLTGKLVHTDETSVAIDCNGVAFHCRTTLTTLSSLGSRGSTVTVFTYLSVRDNAMELYGFSSQSELTWFKMLISVTSIGPRIGIGILSHLSPEDLALSIAAGDVKTLTTAPGVGKKTAQRIILELKDKVESTDIAMSVSGQSTISIGKGNVSEALSALVSLGYNQTQAASALSGEDENSSVQELIKVALRKLAGDN